MPDREKVIKEMEQFRSDFKPFCGGKADWERFDAGLALLKEQEAVEPIRDATCVRMFRCGACGAYVGFVDSDLGVPNEQDNYCRNCGRPVKWDG